MSTSSINTGAAVTGPSFTATLTPGFTGDGSSITGIVGNAITLGSANAAVITGATNHLTTEAQLATTRGGWGINPTTLSGAVVVSAGSITTVAFGSTNTASTLVQRDSSGNFSANNITATELISSPNANGQSTIQTSFISTANATATTLFTLVTASAGTHGTTYFVMADISLGDVTGGSNTGSYQFQFKVKNIGGVITLSSIINQITILDGGLTSTSVSLASTTPNVNVQVIGIAATTINWSGMFFVTQVNF
jgi:hypothetical protein